MGHASVALVMLASALTLGCKGSALRGEWTAGDATEDTVEDIGGPGDTAAGDVEPGDTDLNDTAADDVDVDDVDDDADGSGEDTVAPVPVWALGSLGDAGSLTEIHGVSASLAFAVGGPRVLRYNGAGWASYGEPTGATLHGVWGDGSMVVAVGDGGLIARRGHGDARWVIEASGTSVNLGAVYGRGPDDIYAFGDEATVLHWDGSTWTSLFTVSAFDLYGAWIDPSSTGHDGVYAVGTGGQLVRFGGTWKTEQIAASSVTLRDIFGADGTLFAVGDGHTITMKTAAASNWQGQITNDVAERDLWAITGAAGDDVVAFGDAGVVITYDGARWSVASVAGPLNATADLRAAAWVPSVNSGQGGAGAGGQAGGSYLAVAAAGDGLKRVGGEWIDMMTTPRAGLADMAGSGHDDIWGVGGDGLVMHRTDQGWSAVDMGVDSATDLHGVSVSGAGVVWIVGAGGTVLRWESGAAKVVSTGLPLDLFGVSAASDDGVWASGKGGTLLTIDHDGNTSALVPSGSGADLLAVEVASDGAVWVSGGFGTLLRKADGASDFAPISSGVGGSLNAMTPSAGGVLVAGDNGIILEADATGAAGVHEAPGVFLYGIHRGGGRTVAVGWNGTVLSRSDDGQDFASEVSGVSTVLESVWTDADNAVAAGRQGVLLDKLQE